MKLEMIFIGGLCFALVMIIGFNFYAEMLAEYDTEVDTSTSFGRMEGNLKSIYDQSQDIKTSFQGSVVTEEDAVDEMIRGSYAGVRVNPFDALSITTNQTMQIAKESGYVPAPFLWFFTAVLSILVIFAVIAIAFKFR